MSPRPGTRFLLVGALLLSVSCGSGAGTSVTLGGAGLLAHPAVSLDANVPSITFDGRGGSVFPLDGWAPPEAGGPGGAGADVGYHAWALDGEARLLFPVFAPGDLSLVARARSVAVPEGGVQEMALFLNGRRVGAVTLESRWQWIRIPVEARHLRAGLNEAHLRFARTVSPPTDARSLSAAFSSLAFVPSSLGERSPVLETPVWERVVDSTLELFPGEGLTVTLPPGISGRLRLRGASDGCPSCRLRVRSRAPAEPSGGQGTGDRSGERSFGSTLIWEGSPADVEAAALPFEARRPWSQLLIELVADDDGPAPGSARLHFPEDSLTGVVPASAATTPDRPNLFVFLIDTLRADVLQPYGHEAETSPNLSRFAGDAVTYEQAWAPSAWTLSSVASLFTGLRPREHGALHGTQRLTPDGPPTLASLVGSAGYQSVGISHSSVVGPAFGLERGFDDFLLDNHLGGWEPRSGDAVRLFLAWLTTRADADRPMLVYLHTVDPHAPYAPRGENRRFAEDHPGGLDRREYLPVRFMFGDYGDDPVERRHMRALYEGEVRHADETFGRLVELLRFLGLYADGLVAVTSDHGEEFGEHGGFDHGRTLYEEMIRVPLMVKYPGLDGAGERVRSRVSLLDLHHTLRRAAGVPADPSDGAGPGFGGPVATLALDGDATAMDRDTAYAEVETQRAGKRHGVNYSAVVAPGLKCIRNHRGTDQFGEAAPEWQIYDLDSDPGEATPLVIRPELVQACDASFALWTVGGAATDDTSPVDEETLRELRALGYIQ